MNDFSEVENELRKLRPVSPSAELFNRVESALFDLVAEENIVRPDRFHFNWVSLGVGLAAAALILIALLIDFQKAPSGQVAAMSPASGTRSTVLNPGLIPAGATQVVYNTRDEGLHFPVGSEQPVRQMRSRMHETLQWRNPATGASLQVSYPSEQVEWIPVSGQ